MNVAVALSNVAESLVTKTDDVCGVLFVPLFWMNRWKPIPLP